MRKVLGFLLWFGAAIAAAMYGGEYFGSTGSYIGGTFVTVPVSNLVVMVILLLISGIGRRVFYINNSLVDRVGLVPAILSRINCMRFYWSIAWYSAIAYAVYRFKVLADEGEGILMFGIACLLCFIAFQIVRRSCPRCGHRLSWAGDEDDSTVTVEYEESIDSITAKQGYTEHYYCRRCGKRVFIRGKRTVGQISFR
jgi:ribosomal protein L37E